MRDSVNFKRSRSDYCLFTHFSQNMRCYLLLYVDDILLACNDKNFLIHVKLKLCEAFKMKKLDSVKNFLGINITRNIDNTITIDQSRAIRNLIKKFNLEDCKVVKTPVEKDLNLKRNLDLENKTDLPYKELLGSLMYIMLGTRPDICFCVSYFGQFQDCATNEHFTHLLRVLKYLKFTVDLKLVFKISDRNLIGYCDADWANSLDDRKSISGFCFKLNDNLISWTSKKQPIVSLSSTESEFIAVCMASCELLHIKNLLNDLKINYSLPILLNEDNQSTIKLLKNFENNKRCKHIDVKFHFIVDLLAKGIIDLMYISTNDQLADIFTKSLGNEKFNKMIKMMSLVQNSVMFEGRC